MQKFIKKDQLENMEKHAETNALRNLYPFKIDQAYNNFEKFLNDYNEGYVVGINSVKEVIRKWCKKCKKDETSFFKKNRSEISNISMFPYFLSINKKLYNYNLLEELKDKGNRIFKDMKRLQEILQYDFIANKLVGKKVLGTSEGQQHHENVEYSIRKQKYIIKELVRLANSDLNHHVKSKEKNFFSNKPPTTKQIFAYVNLSVELFNKIYPKIDDKILKYSKNSPIFKFCKDMVNAMFINLSETTIYTAYKYCLMGYGISRQGRKQIRYTVDGKIDLLKIKNKKDFSGIIQKANKYFIKESSW